MKREKITKKHAKFHKLNAKKMMIDCFSHVKDLERRKVIENSISTTSIILQNLISLTTSQMINSHVIVMIVLNIDWFVNDISCYRKRRIKWKLRSISTELRDSTRIILFRVHDLIELLMLFSYYKVFKLWTHLM